MIKHLSKSKYSKGMTLIELLVVLAIFVIVSGLTIFDYGKFRSSVSLQNLADDIALSVRTAQGYAIGVHSLAPTDFNYGYGVHFSTATVPSDTLSGSNKSFIIFSDLNKNKLYDHVSTDTTCNISSNEECLNQLTITSPDIISSICPNHTNCTSTGGVDISFLRPDPDAYIYMSGDSTRYSTVDIVIQNIVSKLTKTITISTVGQISIN